VGSRNFLAFSISGDEGSDRSDSFSLVDATSYGSCEGSRTRGRKLAGVDIVMISAEGGVVQSL